MIKAGLYDKLGWSQISPTLTTLSPLATFSFTHLRLFSFPGSLLLLRFPTATFVPWIPGGLGFTFNTLSFYTHVSSPAAVGAG
jgi:hypothetical protein